jgi:arginyl-tRNA synthetase
MDSLFSTVSAWCRQAVEQTLPETAWGPVDVAVSAQEQFGHYQCNSAMRLAKLLGQPPRKIAEQIAGALRRPEILKVEVAGPGFINITLQPSYLAQRVTEMASDSRLGVPKVKPERVIVEFSSPNVAKEMHVGHLRSTIIGDALARLFEFLGYDVLRLNHIGDWGTAFGMLIAYIKEKRPGLLTGAEQGDLPMLMGLYRESRERFDADSEFAIRARQHVVALQGGDPQALQAWKMICTISGAAYQQIYDLLDVKLTERGESFYNPFLAQVVADFEAKQLLQLSDGAKCVFMEGFRNRDGEPLPLMIQKSDGGYLYATTDLAALHHRIQVEKAKRIIVVVDAGQSLHFQMVFEAARRVGYYDPSQVRVDHVPFGLVLGSDGKKFRTRSGETERLIDLLQAAIEQARATLLEREPGLPAADAEQMAPVIGLGAVKYADLSCHRTTDYQFSYERMLRFEGNTAPFLLYAYVRIASIKRKAGATATGPIQLQEPSELALALHLARFHETLESMTDDLLPHRLSEYLYSLAQIFNAFYRDCQVVGTPQESSRLQLCDLTGRVLQQGLSLLGLRTLERM